jgi:hypothetical protein
MLKRRWIVIGVLVLALACVGLGVLRWGEVVYRRSGGERGWSLGAAAYRLFGWGGSQEYRADFGWTGGREAPETALPPRFGRHGAFGPGHRVPFGPRHMMPFGRAFWPFRFVGGLVFLAFLAAVAVAGVVLYRHWRKRRPAGAPTQPTQ